MYRSIFLNLAWFPLQVILLTIRSPAFQLLSSKTWRCSLTPLILSRSPSYPSTFAVSISCQIYLKFGSFLTTSLAFNPGPTTSISHLDHCKDLLTEFSASTLLPSNQSQQSSWCGSNRVIIQYIFLKDSLVCSKSSNGFSPLPRVKSLRGLW